MSIKEKLRDSWDVWREKVNAKINGGGGDYSIVDNAIKTNGIGYTVEKTADPLYFYLNGEKYKILENGLNVQKLTKVTINMTGYGDLECTYNEENDQWDAHTYDGQTISYYQRRIAGELNDYLVCSLTQYRRSFYVYREYTASNELNYPAKVKLRNGYDDSMPVVDFIQTGNSAIKTEGDTKYLDVGALNIPLSIDNYTLYLGNLTVGQYKYYTLPDTVADAVLSVALKDHRAINRITIAINKGTAEETKKTTRVTLVGADTVNVLSSSNNTPGVYFNNCIMTAGDFYLLSLHLERSSGRWRFTMYVTRVE